MATQASSLQLHGIELPIHLGWTLKERAKKQRVVLDITIGFRKPPKACRTDELDHTFCYDALIHDIHAYLANKSFRLLEYLAKELYSLLKTKLPKATTLSLRLTKFPDIKSLQGGVSFCYGDKM